MPLLRAGNTLGVLVVQNRTYRVYAEEEIEALQTTAMVLAEMHRLRRVAGAGAGRDADIALRRPLQLTGRAARRRRRPRPRRAARAARRREEPHRRGSRQASCERLEEAIAEVRASIDELIERGDVAHHGEHREVLETFRMFAHDQGWLRRMREAVALGPHRGGRGRARAVGQPRPDAAPDRSLSARAAARPRRPRQPPAAPARRPRHGGDRRRLPENAILVARSMGPAALLDYDRSRLRGLVLEEGGPTSHIAIVARALGIPAVGEVANATSLVEHGRRHHRRRRRPATSRSARSADVEAAYAEKARLRARRQEQYRTLRDVPAVTRDGVRDRPAAQCGPRWSTCPISRRRARRASACSAPSCNS